MDLQKKILNQYFRVFGKMTFKKISEETGIQMTRVFRIMNGSPMKLNEYEIFKNLIDSRSGDRKMEDIALECGTFLPPPSLKELKVQLERLLKLKSLVQGQNVDVEIGKIS